MNKLQTLKDIEAELDDDSIVWEEPYFLDHLKAEALKWIKGDLALFEYGSKTWKFIVHFFNLEEEELFNTTGIDGEISNTPKV